MNNRDEYLATQKRFWNTPDLKTAMFERVCTLDPTAQLGAESIWIQDAERSLDHVMRGVDFQPSWTVLELGCGVGRLIHLLRERIPFQQIIGIAFRRT